VLRIVGILALVPGCTIVFNSNDLPRRSDAPPPPDSKIVDATIFDVNPANLMLTSVEPTTLVEGTGSSGGRPAVVVVRGNNIDTAATLEIVAGTDPLPVGLVAGTAVASNDHTMIALPVTVPVIGNLAKGEQLHLQVKVSQAGATAQMLPITVDGLGELTTSGATSAATVNANGPYSSASLTQGTHFTGTAPVHVVVTGGITVSAAIDADANKETAGPGGCDGGTTNVAAGCGKGAGVSGNAGLSGAAGGGGGFGAAGHPGTGSSGNGAGGMITGDPMLVKLDYSAGEEGNRGNGGGGGGGATIGTAGTGGGGGGTIELTAGGTITISGAGAVRSKGGDGIKGSGVTPGGDGGGGSGGAILVRTGGGVSPASVGGWLSAPAGGNSGGSGGAGAIGRIRVDSPNGSVAAMGNPSATQGPSWALGTGAPVIARSASTSLALIGQIGNTYAIIVNQTAKSPAVFAGGSMVQVPVDLIAGHNSVCAVADDKIANSGSPVAVDCIDVVLVP
jgi:hypothetical protein